MPGVIEVSERVERMQDLREMLKYERQHWVAAVEDDPFSVETFVYGLSIAALEKELDELGRGV